MPPEHEAQEPRAPLWRPLGAILFCALVLAAYYATHKPVSPDRVPALLAVALDVLASGLVVVAGLAVGRWLLDRLAGRLSLDLNRVGRAATLSVSGLLGLALLSAMGLALGLLGLFQSVALWVLLILVLVVFHTGLWRTWADTRPLMRAARPDSRFTIFLIVFVVLQLGLALVVAFAPPHGWDSLTYHLIEPARMLESGRITASTDNFYLGLPKLVETLFGIGIGLFGRDTVAAPIHFAFGALGLLAVMGLARRWTGRAESGWLAAALLLAGYNTWALFGYAYVDLAVFALAAAAIVCALAWDGDRRTGWLLVAGLLAGSAAGVKYTAAPLAVGVALLVVLRARQHALRPLIVLVLAAALAYLPWALRGWLVYGNPIYPYLFTPADHALASIAEVSGNGRGLLWLGLGWQIPFLPLAAAIIGGELENTYFYTAGPFLLTAPFLLLFGWRWVTSAQRRAVWSALILLVPLYAVWAIAAATSAVGMQTRLAITVFPLMAALGALAVHALEQMPRKPVQAGFIVKALIAVTLIASALETVQATVASRPLEPLLGFVSRGDYERQFLGPYGDAYTQLQTLPEGTGVRFLFEPRSYVCPEGVTCKGDTAFNFWNNARRRGLEWQAIFDEWAQSGESYVLFFNEGHRLWMDMGATYTPEIDNELPEALQTLGVPVWTSPGGLYTLYRLPAPEG